MPQHPEDRFCHWVRSGMADPAPSFEELHDNRYFLPLDVIEILQRERGLEAFWSYGQAVSQLAGEPPDPKILAKYSRLRPAAH
jgi:hypothetical protein